MTLAAQELASGSHAIDLLCFDIGAERFAFRLADVEEVVDGVQVATSSLTQNVNAFIQLRDELVPVHAIDVTLGVTSTSVEPFALVLALNDYRVAVLVDNAEAALAVDINELREVPSLAELDRLFIGAIRVGGRWVSFIDSTALVELLLPPNAELEIMESVDVR